MVSGVGFINNLSVGTLTPASITTSQINGNPDLELSATNVTVNGSALVTADSTTTFTNKSIASDTNTITIASLGDNINDVLDQRVTTLSNVNFLDVTTVGGVFAGGAGQFSQVLTNAVNDPSASNNCLINGVNPLTTANTLAANVDQDVKLGSNPEFNSVNCTSILTTPLINDYAYANTTTVNGVNPLTTDTYLHDNVDQDLRTSASPTFVTTINSGNSIRVETSQTPASASAAGTTGTICWDSSYIYVCTATNTWRRVAHSAW